MGEAPKEPFGPPAGGEDGTREGGLVFALTVIGGIVVASIVHPLALTSFFVWFALLMLSVSAAVGVQRLVLAWFHGGQADESEYDRFRRRERR